MINAGIGERQANTFLTTLKLPPVHHKTLKTVERKVGQAFEVVADESIHIITQQEQQLQRDRYSNRKHHSFDKLSVTVAREKYLKENNCCWV